MGQMSKNILDPNSINMSGLSIDDIYVGRTACFSRTITNSDVLTFAGLIGDFNPIHVNEEYAKTTRFGQRIAHGMLTASFISTVLGMSLPGAEALYLGQTIQFRAPVRLGDTITAKAEVIKVIPEKKRFVCRTTVTNQDGEIVVEGEATMLTMME